MASRRSPSSLTLRRGLAVRRCHNGRRGSGSAGRLSSSTNTTYRGGRENHRRRLEMSHHRYRNGSSSNLSPSRGEVYKLLDDLRYLQVLVHLSVEPGRAVFPTDVVVIRDAGEQVVRPRRDVGPVRPLLPLQLHIALFLVLP